LRANLGGHKSAKKTVMGRATYIPQVGLWLERLSREQTAISMIEWGRHNKWLTFGVANRLHLWNRKTSGMPE
jgi:hypothetical protein